MARRLRPNACCNVATVLPTVDRLTTYEPCPQCEQLAREHSEAAAELWELNKTYGIGAQWHVSVEEQASDNYRAQTEVLRAAHERCAKARMALLGHRKHHGF